ncbi:hypothetical protein TKK_0017336 [Trichogramma kaykai]
MLVDAIRDETLLWRSLILSNVNCSIRDALSSTQPNEMLFGSTLSEDLKQAKAINQDVMSIAKKPTSSENSKNYRTPLHQSNKSQQQSTSSGYKSKKETSSYRSNKYHQEKKPTAPKDKAYKNQTKKYYSRRH